MNDRKSGVIYALSAYLIWGLLAASGVALKTILAGSFPFVAVVLALSFGFYGLLKKISTDSAMTGVAAETLVILPIVLFYIIRSEVSGPAAFTGSPALTKLLFISTGVVTVTPLFLFSKAAGRIPLVWVGFLQFLAPTLMMIFGIFLFHEEMTAFDLTGFAAVWAAIILFVISNRRRVRKTPEAEQIS
jgi:chloramphenicol-sensitive protein RarD